MTELEKQYRLKNKYLLETNFKKAQEASDKIRILEIELGLPLSAPRNKKERENNE